MPAFSQLFFYEFSNLESSVGMGQPSSCSSSRRAAETYIRSGIRLRSRCGISDIWYRYVEDHQTLYSRGTIHPLPVMQYPRHPRPCPDGYHERYLWSVLQWAKMHSRPQPRKKKPIKSESSSSFIISSSTSESVISDIEYKSSSGKVACESPTLEYTEV